MRICLLTPEFRPSWGGVGTYTYNLARALRDRAEVHVVTCSDPAAGTDGLPDGVQLHPIHPGAAKVDGLGLSFQLAAYRRIPELARAHDFDIVHSNHAYMSDLLLRHRRLSCRSVLTVHTTLGTQIEGTLRAGGSAPLGARERKIARWRHLFRRIERRYLLRTRAMIFVSRWVREQAVSRYGLAPPLSSVIPNGVDTARLAAAGTTERGERDPEDGGTLLFAGRLLALKGIDTLLRAVVRLDPGVRLRLAGPGDPTPWRSLGDRLGLDPRRIEFLGPVRHEAMFPLYREADAVVLPSFTESCPMVALEAMASGTPLVAANVGGVREIVEDGTSGWLFPPGDAEALADRVRAILSDPDRAGAVAETARRWVEANASVGLMARRTLRFYEDALGEAS